MEIKLTLRNLLIGKHLKFQYNAFDKLPSLYFFVFMTTEFTMNYVIIYYLNKSYGQNAETVCWTIISFHPFRRKPAFCCYYIQVKRMINNCHLKKYTLLYSAIIIYFQN